jgi:hypothetical protein
MMFSAIRLAEKLCQNAREAHIFSRKKKEPPSLERFRHRITVRGQLRPAVTMIVRRCETVVGSARASFWCIWSSPRGARTGISFEMACSIILPCDSKSNVPVPTGSRLPNTDQVVRLTECRSLEDLLGGPLERGMQQGPVS